MIAPPIAALAVPITSLTVMPGNPRRGDVEAVQRSLTAFGQQKPVVWHKRGGKRVIVAGNHTWMAASELGWESIAAVEFSGTKAEADAFGLADNHTSDLGSYDNEALLALLQEVQAADVDLLAATSFDDEDLAALVRANRNFKYVALDPEDGSPPLSQVGDLWLLGPHRLLCGDSTAEENLRTLMGRAKPQMVWTDPPYGMNLDTEYSKTHQEGGDYAPVIGDDVPFDFRAALALVDDVREQFWWGADYYCQDLPAGGSWIVWDKRSTPTGDVDAVHGSTFELCWSRQPHRREIARVLWSGTMGMSNDDTRGRVHPTQKPTLLCDWFLERWGKRGDNVLDLYAGSGTTVIGCEKAGRVAHVMELDPHYVDIICHRWQSFSGTKPVLERTGEEHDFA